MTDQNNITSGISKIEANVMRRVRTMHLLQPLFTSMAVSVGLFVVALWGIGREVWVARVFQDEPSITNFNAVAHFYLAAFMDTRFIVQVLSVLVIAAFIWFVRNAIQTVSVGLRFA